MEYAGHADLETALRYLRPVAGQERIAEVSKIKWYSRHILPRNDSILTSNLILRIQREGKLRGSRPEKRRVALNEQNSVTGDFSPFDTILLSCAERKFRM